MTRRLAAAVAVALGAMLLLASDLPVAALAGPAALVVGGDLLRRWRHP